jgi:hypothetical protein
MISCSCCLGPLVRPAGVTMMSATGTSVVVSCTNGSVWIGQYCCQRHMLLNPTEYTTARLSRISQSQTESSEQPSRTDPCRTTPLVVRCTWQTRSWAGAFKRYDPLPMPVRPQTGCVAYTGILPTNNHQRNESQGSIGSGTLYECDAAHCLRPQHACTTVPLKAAAYPEVPGCQLGGGEGHQHLRLDAPPAHVPLLHVPA